MRIFYSKATRQLYVEIPSEGKEAHEDVVGRLLRSLYGTRDAPLNWELTIAEFMKRIGFLQGKSNPCIYYQEARNLRVEVHGDAFTSVGPYMNPSSGFMRKQAKNGTTTSSEEF